VTGSHVKIGFLALCIALLLGVPAAWLSNTRKQPTRETTIAVEHSAPATMRVARLASSGANIYEITLTGSGVLAAHLPSAWKRTEVRGVPIAAMVGEPQQWNYVRWVMPSGATARFETPNPGRVTMHNPSNIPLTVSTTVVRGGTRYDDAQIVTDEPYLLP
jgi:hypothetical protein